MSEAPAPVHLPPDPEPQQPEEAPPAPAPVTDAKTMRSMLGEDSDSSDGKPAQRAPPSSAGLSARAPPASKLSFGEDESSEGETPMQPKPKLAAKAKPSSKKTPGGSLSKLLSSSLGESSASEAEGDDLGTSLATSFAVPGIGSLRATGASSRGAGSKGDWDGAMQRIGIAPGGPRGVGIGGSTSGLSRSASASSGAAGPALPSSAGIAPPAAGASASLDDEDEGDNSAIAREALAMAGIQSGSDFDDGGSDISLP